LSVSLTLSHAVLSKTDWLADRELQNLDWPVAGLPRTIHVDNAKEFHSEALVRGGQEYPPRDRMPCLVIYGATGMGKTRIIQKFLRDNRSHFDRKLGRTRAPVVSIQMAKSPVSVDDGLSGT
jgi:hypothetical protein